MRFEKSSPITGDWNSDIRIKKIEFFPKKTVDFLFPLALQLCHEKAPQRA
jgi:hypothetical protein